MATTSPDTLRTPDPGDSYNLVADLAILGQDVQNALTLRANAYTGTVSQRTAFTSTATDGMLWQDTDGIKMIWRKDGAAWVPAVWRWSGSTAQMNGFSPPDGFEWFNTTDSREYVRLGGAWVKEWSRLWTTTSFTPSSGSVSNSSITRNTQTGVVNLFLACERTVWSSGTTSLGTLPTAFRPSSAGVQMAVAWNGASTPYVSFGQITVGGVVNVHGSPPNGQHWAASLTAIYNTVV